MARIDNSDGTIVADGTNLITYDKSSKTYTKEPETTGNLLGLFTGDDLAQFAPFFGGTLPDAGAKSLGPTTHKGMSVTAIQATGDSAGRTSVTYFVGSDSLLHALRVITKTNTQSDTTIWDASAIQVNGALGASVFTFVPPAGSRELSLDEINSTKWHLKLQDALDIATKTHKKVFVDFCATWCGPCKALERECLNTDRFKALSKKLVFCRIDVDENQDLAQQYQATAIPMQLVMTGDGSIVSKQVGYSDPDQFFSWIDSVL
jgi:thiol-disulfide isomerase/thioredoxin